MAGGADAFAEWASQPFEPSNFDGGGDRTDVPVRIAVALEYIAAQLGEISRKMDYVGSGLGATRDDFDAMTELLKQL